mgnify:FL=1
MINLSITITQQVNNKANAKRDFTTYLSKSKDRYILAVKNLYTGKNPSTCFDLISRISDTIDKNIYDSVGGWMDTKTDIYYLDANMHFDSLNECISNAKGLGELAIYDTIDNKVIYIN